MQTQSHSSGLSGCSSESKYLLVFLGASNLGRGFTALSNCLVKALSPHPVEIINAFGPGRGYCAKGGFLFVKYPPVWGEDIRLFIREKARDCSRILVLVTDIGNDIMYGVPAEDVIRCLENIFREFKNLNAHLLVSAIHVDLEKDLNETYFRILRTFFYPRSHVKFATAAASVKQINRFLENSRNGHIHLLKGMKEYAGADKIHYSLSKSHKGWSRVAEEAFRMLDCQAQKRINLLHMVHSIFSYLYRLIFLDVLRLHKKTEGSF